MRLADLPAARAVPWVTAAQMAEVDGFATSTLGIGGDVLMENAAHQVARAVRALLGGRVVGRRIVGLVGAGNNGGDAAAALRHLAGWGAIVHAIVATPEARTKDMTRLQLERLRHATGHTTAVTSFAEGAPIATCDVIVDGLLGYSARGAPRDAVAALIAAANAAGVPIAAVDLPSGVDPDTGDAPGEAIRAALTVTLALPKKGLVAKRAAALVGTLLVADIGIPHVAFARIGVGTTQVFLDDDLVRVLP